MSDVWVVETGGPAPRVPSNGRCRNVHPFKDLACLRSEGHQGYHATGEAIGDDMWTTTSRWALTEDEIRTHFVREGSIS